jgi:predicted GNAT family acetyltransferase
MDQVISIIRRNDADGGRYEARVEGREGLGELTYRRRSATTIVADHTGVADSLRGTGVAKALVERLVADAREEGLRIVPGCSFVRAQFDRRPEWSDVLAT